MKLKRFLLACAFIGCFVQGIYATGFTGNELLSVLGMKTSSTQFKQFRDYWQLDKQNLNYARGIKLFVNEISDRVESIVIVGENSQTSITKFSKYSASLPFGISLDDNVATLKSKLGEYEKLIGRSALKFYKDSIIIEASFTSLSDGKISYLKFAQGVKITLPVITLREDKPQPSAKDKMEARRRQLEKNTFTQPGVDAGAKKPDTIPAFKKAIMGCFQIFSVQCI
jgi:hypothetical protein